MGRVRRLILSGVPLLIGLAVVGVDRAAAEDPPSKAPAVRERLAVIDFAVSEKLRTQEPDLGATLASYATASLNKKYDVVARADLVKALEETKLQMSDLFDSAEKGAQVGKFVKAKKVLAGRASSVGSKVALDLKIMDVETGSYGDMAAESGDKMEDFLAMIPRLLGKIGLAEAATAASPAAPVPPPSAAPVDPRTLLRDLTRWDAATSEQRRAAAQFVADRTEGFSPSGLKTFACGGQTHEVALFRHERSGMDFVLIPAGTFTMGSPTSEPDRGDDETQHTVTLTRPFLLARTEVTQAAWDAVWNSDSRQFAPQDGDPARSHDKRTFRGTQLPIEGVTWDEAQGYSARVGLALPTEAQWEWACRAGSRSAWSTGTDARSLQGFANICDAYAKTHAAEIPYDTSAWKWTDDVSDGFATTAPVKTFAANAFGLFDMHGNVWEWCADWYGPYASGSVTDPTGPSAASFRVSRGGCWGGPARFARSALRFRLVPGLRFVFLGFRPARSVTLE